MESDIMFTRSDCSARATTRSAASGLSARGFVTRTCLPAFSAFSAMGTCSWFGVPTMMASMSASAHIAS